MVYELMDTKVVRVLKHVIRCYLRLSEHPRYLSRPYIRSREALRQCLPEPLRNATFAQVLKDDAVTKRCLQQMLVNLSDNPGNI